MELKGLLLMSSKFKILDSESLETLRTMAYRRTAEVQKPLSELIVSLDLTLVDSPYEVILPSNELEYGTEWSTGGKLPLASSNALTIYQMLPEFAPAHASDERLWVTLTWGNFFEYATKRWIVADEDARITNYKNHWFGGGTRAGWRDQAVSRLWWVGYFAHNSGLSVQDSLRVLYWNSEFLNSFLGHPRTVASTRIRSQLMNLIASDYINKDVDFDRDWMRKMMKELDFRGGAMEIDSLDDKELSVFIKEIMVAAHK
jgi:hypothetical protein